MNLAKRVVLDTSTLISAALRPDSIPRQVLLLAIANATLCASPSTMAELEQVLLRDKFDRYLDTAYRREFLELYRRHARLFDVNETEEAALSPPCRDPRDNKFLALTMHCKSDALVTSDADLLILHPYHGIPILAPKAFLVQKVFGK